MRSAQNSAVTEKPPAESQAEIQAQKSPAEPGFVCLTSKLASYIREDVCLLR
jgi:hypothetical protein